MADKQTDKTKVLQAAAQEAAPIVDKVKEQGQQYAGQAAALIGTRVKDAATQQKDALATGITDVANILKQNTDSLKDQGVAAFAAPYLDMAASKLNEVGSGIHEKSMEEVIKDTEQFARTQPTVFLAVAALLGFAAARFLKSSGAPT